MLKYQTKTGEHEELFHKIGKNLKGLKKIGENEVPHRIILHETLIF